ncbi:HsdM family class I SAM-dependent methyltransferase [Mycoplasmopsis agassizii]|uniref:HsdM family class I SAM-dependent methyltransferase n=1 Tax=Mycoplasmopsis agassizii TaxID=33922 RepID=UPI0009D8B92B|nr:N-6 DNA methylase [Mycoplasmopsis agassizii]SMC18663.1 N-6 DNA Methylase [Mycoplasmopsis agassizii]
MAIKEVETDVFVRNVLEKLDIWKTGNCSQHGSNVKEIEEALKTASKSKTGYRGVPEFVCVLENFVLVIENKASLSRHIKLDKNGSIGEDKNSVKNYAVNGALHYGKQIVKNSANYKKVFAVGFSGSEDHHTITPIFINYEGKYKRLDDLKSFSSFQKNNINKYYESEVLNHISKSEKDITTEEIINTAKKLSNELRNLGTLMESERPIIVSGIFLALSEIRYKSFNIDSLNSDRTKSDGQKIYDAISANLSRSKIPTEKQNKMLSQFKIFIDNEKINTYTKELDGTPLMRFTKTLYNKIFNTLSYEKSSEDFLGRFYSEFMSYRPGDGQNLGVVLTPRHITDLFCDLLDLKKTDKVFDPCCGTGGFLISAMQYMLSKTDDDIERDNIRTELLVGVELQSYMFTIAATNMLLRGDGKSNLHNEDFLKKPSSEWQKMKFSKGMMNPPYSQNKDKNTEELHEINFVNHLLDSITKGGGSSYCPLINIHQF